MLDAWNSTMGTIRFLVMTLITHNKLGILSEHMRAFPIYRKFPLILLLMNKKKHHFHAFAIYDPNNIDDDKDRPNISNLLVSSPPNP